MAEPKDKDKGAGGTGGGDGGGGTDREGIRAVVADVLGDLFKDGKADVRDGGGGKGKGSDGGGDIDAQVNAAVKRIRDQDARDQAERDRDARLAALEEKVKTPEAVPKQVRRVTRFMWGEDD